MKSTYLEAKSIINGKPFDEIVNLPKIDKRFSYGTLNGSEGEGLVDLNFKDILVTVRNNNGVATIVNYEQYDANGQFTDLVHTNESKTKKNTVKLNEAQLKKIIAESVRKVLKEYNEDLYDSIAADARYGDGVYPEPDIYNKQFLEVKSHIEAAEKLLNTIDPTDYEDITDIADEKLTEIYDKLEDIIGDLNTFISGDFVVSQYPKRSIYNA